MTVRDAGRGAGLMVEGVSHHYGAIRVLHDVTLAVSSGQIHSLLGPSGSGKSTLLRLVAGLETLVVGQIAIAGQQVASPSREVPPERRAVGFVFQDYALFPHLNVAKNVLFGMPHKEQRARRARLDQLLQSVGMSDFAGAMPHTLSGGQQQRVALARALAREPIVMLLDEPFSGLDARQREEIRDLTLRVLRAEQVATLLVTHDPQEALLASDVISVIREGRIEQTGAPRELYFSPTTRHVAEVFGKANRFDGIVQQGGVATPWGIVAAPSRCEGERVTVLFRPESLILTEESAPHSAAGRVLRNSLRGETCEIEIELSSGEMLLAAVPSHTTWKAGITAHVSVLHPSAIILLPAKASPSP